jgi:ribosomal protein S9
MRFEMSDPISSLLLLSPLVSSHLLPSRLILQVCFEMSGRCAVRVTVRGGGESGGVDACRSEWCKAISAALKKVT